MAIRTGMFNPDESKFAKGIVCELPYPSDDTRSIIRAALRSLRFQHSFRPSLASNSAEIWTASRRVKGNEVDAMAEQADMTSADSEHIIAIDGPAILVHPSNPVDELSIETMAHSGIPRANR